MRLEPGELQPWQLHHHPYLVLALEEEHNRMDFLDGSEAKHMHEIPDRVVNCDPGKVHNLYEGNTRHVNRLIELKQLGEDGRPG